LREEQRKQKVAHGRLLPELKTGRWSIEVWTCKNKHNKGGLVEKQDRGTVEEATNPGVGQMYRRVVKERQVMRKGKAKTIQLRTDR